MTQQEQRADWQTIESAPQDGTSVLVWRSDWDEPLIARFGCCYDFFTDLECYQSGLDDEGLSEPGWFSADFVQGCVLDSDQSPTHWLPLPVAPKEGV